MQSAQGFLTDLARAFGGAILFSFPILMTMETWWLGFYLPPERIGLLMLVALPILLGLSHISGFRPTPSWLEDVVDVFVAYAVGLITAATFLGIFGVIDGNLALGDALAQIGLLSVPCSIGAILSSKQLGNQRASNEDRKSSRRVKYHHDLGIITAGALYGSFTVSPTAEMFLISFKMPSWLLLGLTAISLLLMHGFTYGMNFGGRERAESKAPLMILFYRYTVVGYAIALGMSTYILWTFGRLEGMDFHTALGVIVVLGLPAAIGASVSRLVI